MCRYLLYGEQAYMWSVAELIRKLVLTSLIILFFETGSGLQITFALLVSAFAHVAHALYRPFVNRPAYLLQHASLTVTTMMYVRAGLFGHAATPLTCVCVSVCLCLCVAVATAGTRVGYCSRCGGSRLTRTVPAAPPQPATPTARCSTGWATSSCRRAACSSLSAARWWW